MVEKLTIFIILIPTDINCFAATSVFSIVLCMYVGVFNILYSKSD